MGMKKEKVVNEDDIDNDSIMRRVQNSSSSVVSREENRHVQSDSRNLQILHMCY